MKNRRICDKSPNLAMPPFTVSDMELLTGIYLPIFLIFQIVKKINKYLLRNEEDYLGYSKKNYVTLIICRAHVAIMRI